MGQLYLEVCGARYPVGCGDGEEPHLRSLARQISVRLAQVKKSLAPANDAHALFLTALLLADEAYESGRQDRGEEEIGLLEKVETLALQQEEASALLEGLAARAEEMVAD